MVIQSSQRSRGSPKWYPSQKTKVQIIKLFPSSIIFPVSETYHIKSYCPIHGNIQGQVGWASEQPDLVKMSHSLHGGWTEWFLKIPSEPNHSRNLWYRLIAYWDRLVKAFIPLFCLMPFLAQYGMEMSSACAAFLYLRPVNVQNHCRKILGNLNLTITCFFPFLLYSFCKVRNFEEEGLNKYGIYSCLEGCIILTLPSVIWNVF